MNIRFIALALLALLPQAGASEDPAAALKPATLIMPAGYSRQIRLPFAADSSHGDSSCVVHRLVQDAAGANTAVLIVARRSCSDTLTFTNRATAATKQIRVTVLDPKGNKIIDNQMANERGEGLIVKRLLVPPGKFALAMEFHREVGPVYLADASVLTFTRLGQNPKSLQVKGIKTGGTDLLVFDSTGKPIAKYYFDVRPVEVLPSWLRPTPNTEGQFQYIDLTQSAPANARQPAAAADPGSPAGGPRRPELPK